MSGENVVPFDGDGISNDPSAAAGFGGFPTTSWTYIEAMPDRNAPGYREHMNRLILDYWRPVFYFLRARGYPLTAAEDLTQEFFGFSAKLGENVL